MFCTHVLCHSILIDYVVWVLFCAYESVVKLTVPKIKLVEKSSPLQYIQESGIRDGKRKYLGKLAGPGAVFNEPTRNGRRYPYELWIKVQNSPEFQEGIRTLTIFGECDHPEDRMETSIKEIAIVLTKFEIREDEGIIWTEFDILDTPNGRILKELLDYGSQIGVSSRGLGEEIIRDGEKIVNPDTYEFYAFDAVIMPAVKSARPTLIESVNEKSSTTEAIIEQINRATSRYEVESMKKILESTGLLEIDSIKESINIKLDSYNGDGEDISSKLQADLGMISKQKEELEKKVKDLEESLSAKDIRVKSLMERLRKTTMISRKLRKLVTESRLTISELQNSAAEILESEQSSRSEMKRHMIIMNDAVNFNKDMKKKLQESENKIHQLTESIDELTKQNKSLLTENKTLSKKLELFNDIKNTNIQLTETLKKFKKKSKLTENASHSQVSNLTMTLEKTKKELDQALQYYMKTECAKCGISVETVQNLLPKSYSVKDIDKIISELVDRKDRLNKLPVVLTPTTVILNDDLNTMSEDERQTLNFLIEAKKQL